MDYKAKLASVADEYDLQVIYAFGSRAKEIFNIMHQKIYPPAVSNSDLDIGIKPEKPLTVQEKVKIAIFFEDLFGVPKADVVEIPEAPITLALEIVQGELLYARDENFEAEYQLYIMSRLKAGRFYFVLFILFFSSTMMIFGMKKLISSSSMMV